MTNREFYEEVIKSGVSETLVEFAENAIAKLDEKNKKRSSKPTKIQLENAPLKAMIVDYLTENSGRFTENELGVVLEITHNKAGALARQLEKEGVISATKIKIPKVGERKVYFIGEETEEEKEV